MFIFYSLVANEFLSTVKHYLKQSETTANTRFSNYDAAYTLARKKKKKKKKGGGEEKKKKNT
jgi:hypothetical protein